MRLEFRQILVAAGFTSFVSQSSRRQTASGNPVKSAWAISCFKLFAAKIGLFVTFVINTDL